jgi:rfaE bifunctional protein nucleotidyltransferase chain/domain
VSVIRFEDLASLRAELGDRTVALGTGCFDIVHVGHVYFINQAAEQADVLVVGVNSDRSVRTIKGEHRPVVGERERAAMLAAMRGVDHVVIYDDVVADDCIRALRPEVYVTGAESVGGYPSELVAARDVGARVHVVDRLPDHSTTSIVAAVQRGDGAGRHR